MKLYKRKDFIKLPKNTIYSRVDHNVGDLFIGLFCKVSAEDFGNDWVEQNLISEVGCPDHINDGMEAYCYFENIRDSFQEFGTDLQFSGRDGLFEEKDLFVVWDKKDIEKLYNYLGKCLNR